MHLLKTGNDGFQEIYIGKEPAYISLIAQKIHIAHFVDFLVQTRFHLNNVLSIPSVQTDFVMIGTRYISYVTHDGK